MNTNCVTVLAISCAVGMANADIGVISLGTDAPPALVPAGTSAGWPITYAPLDPRPLFSDVTRADVALDCFVAFSTPMSHRRIGDGWATWSHGYTGDVYYSNGATTVTMALHSDMPVDYFGFSAEPNPFGVFSMTAVGMDTGGGSASLTQSVEGSAGATGWGFYTTGGTSIVSVELSSDVDFAIGEFGMHKIPAPGSIAMLGLAGVSAFRRRR